MVSAQGLFNVCMCSSLKQNSINFFSEACMNIEQQIKTCVILFFLLDLIVYFQRNCLHGSCFEVG